MMLAFFHLQKCQFIIGSEVALRYLADNPLGTNFLRRVVEHDSYTVNHS